ncbi:MAG: OmpA family protein [Bacteroidales bacterium]|nr:OmpA family protein [Bacteroidales bacterium]
MKSLILFFSLLLALWIAGASYWFVCRTMCDCRNSPNPAAIAEKANAHHFALIAAAEEAKAYVTGSGTQKIYFETARASADMSALAPSYVEKLKLYLDNYPDARIVITGYADNAGPDHYNMMLSELRARFVKNWLILTSGISGEQIEIMAKGTAEPAADNNTPEGREKNRRTEIHPKI